MAGLGRLFLSHEAGGPQKVSWAGERFEQLGLRSEMDLHPPLGLYCL